MDGMTINHIVSIDHGSYQEHGVFHGVFLHFFHDVTMKVTVNHQVFCAREHHEPAQGSSKCWILFDKSKAGISKMAVIDEPEGRDPKYDIIIVFMIIIIFIIINYYYYVLYIILLNR
jgi:hypothetical protein